MERNIFKNWTNIQSPQFYSIRAILFIDGSTVNSGNKEGPAATLIAAGPLVFEYYSPFSVNKVEK